jgi:multidrug efflux pump subunit AcrB
VEWTFNRLAKILSQYRELTVGEASEEMRLPIGGASFACLVSFLIAYLVTRAMAVLLDVWWAELLVCVLIPIATTFIILYSSCWHTELRITARIGMLLLVSCVIYLSVFIAIIVLIVIACFFAIAWSTDMGPG